MMMKVRAAISVCLVAIIFFGATYQIIMALEQMEKEENEKRLELEQYKEGEMQQTQRVLWLEGEVQRLRNELYEEHKNDVSVPLVLEECADRIEEAMWLLEGSECCICVHDPDEWERRYKVWKEGK